jgi:hypothetical protein
MAEPTRIGTAYNRWTSYCQQLDEKTKNPEFVKLALADLEDKCCKEWPAALVVAKWWNDRLAEWVCAELDALAKRAAGVLPEQQERARCALETLASESQKQSAKALTPDGFPRRCYVDKMVPAELAITQAMYAVEAMPPDVRLTDAVTLLDKAREKVADFVDGLKAEPVPEFSNEVRVTPEQCAGFATEVRAPTPSAEPAKEPLPPFFPCDAIRPGAPTTRCSLAAGHGGEHRTIGPYPRHKLIVWWPAAEPATGEPSDEELADIFNGARNNLGAVPGFHALWRAGRDAERAMCRAAVARLYPGHEDAIDAKGD